MLKPLIFPSPDKKHKAVLTPLGKIQADHHDYSLSIDGLPHLFTGRFFGEICLWSPESRFLAVQEWKQEWMKSPETGSATRFCVLLILDMSVMRECVIANVDEAKGNILPESFIGESLMYTVIYYGAFGMTKSFESKFRDLKDWQVIQ
jgi:hypothetical protein